MVMAPEGDGFPDRDFPEPAARIEDFPWEKTKRPDRNRQHRDFQDATQATFVARVGSKNRGNTVGGIPWNVTALAES
jgi:hypothetical protein